ncbi:MAG TPA: hypothetical protein VHG28_00355 [Longimicrobiaceae bacterium]|nr:hypothetical protein [Longimicrobiaceae bacterium]
MSTRTVGSLLSLPVVQQTTNAAGQTVRQVRDPAGAVVEYTLDTTGRIVGARVLQQAPQRR